MSTIKAKLFAIRCSINQAIGISYIKCIVIITDSLHTAKKIFDSSSHSYQIHSATITHKLREFPGIVPVRKTGDFTQQLTRMPESSRLQSTSHANHHETSVRNTSVTTLYCSGRYHFKHLISKEEIFLNF